MPIPTRLNPMGKNEKKYFELIVKPGILASDMTYGVFSAFNDGGYCKVDWGDGNKDEAVSTNITISHTYTVAGTYKVKIQANCSRINLGAVGRPIVYDCSDDFSCLIGLTSGNYTFSECSNAVLSLTRLPEQITGGLEMFSGCTNAQLPLTSLPEGLTNGQSMFNSCSNATLPLTSLPDGLTNCASMFRGCSKAQLSLTYLPAGLTNGASMFVGCTKSEFAFTKLPDGITSGCLMFYGAGSGVEINLDTLVANAPADGWVDLTNISGMFYACPNVTGSRSAFLSKCPNVTNITDAFRGTNTTE